MTIYDHEVLHKDETLTVLGDDISLDTIINNGGREIVIFGGHAQATEINKGGLEIVDYNGVATNTFLRGGTLDIEREGTAQNVAFAAGHSTVQVADPINPITLQPSLQGVIQHMQVGDIIAFPLIRNATLEIDGNTVTMAYTQLGVPHTVTYTFAETQLKTHFILQPETGGGYDLTLTRDTPVVGIADTPGYGHGLV